MKKEQEFFEKCCTLCKCGFCDGDAIYYSKIDDGIYCSMCAMELADSKYADADDLPYKIYIADNGKTGIVLDSYSFGNLEYGVYKLKEYKNVIAAFIVEEVKESKTSIRGHMNNICIMEKIKDKTAFFYSNEKQFDKYDFVEGEECDLIARNLMLTGDTFAHYIVDNTNIIGIVSCGNSSSYDLSGLVLANDEMSAMSFSKLKVECKRLPYHKKVERSFRAITPTIMREYFEKRIQGQGQELINLLYLIYTYIESVALGTTFVAENFALVGPSGCGKTEVYRTLRAFLSEYDLPVPVVQIDLSRVTEEGFKGTDPSEIPQIILSQYPDTNGVCICFFDEADKKCIPSYSNNGNVNDSIQANLLTLAEGTIVPIKDSDKNFNKNFDTGLTMCVFMGTFQEYRKSKRKEKQEIKIGFNIDYCEETDAVEKHFDLGETLTIEDLIKVGMIEELAGRISQVINFHKLPRENMQRVIRCKVEEISEKRNVKIEITEDAVENLIDISYSDMGVRYPINKIKELINNTISKAFFSNDFDYKTDSIIIKSLESANVVRRRERKERQAG